MEIECLSTLNEQQKTEIQTLHSACMQAEGLRGEVFLSNELNYDRTAPTFFLGRESGVLVAFLTLFLPTCREAEVNAFTLPAARRRGRFTALMTEAKRVCAAYGVPSLLFVVESHAKAARAVLLKLPNVRWQHTEYRMHLIDIQVKKQCADVCAVPVTAANIAQYRAMQAAYDEKENEDSAVQSVLTNSMRTGYLAVLHDEPIGLCHMHTEDDTAFIYGLALMPAMRGRGYGEAFMREILRLAIATGLPVMLDVDSKNKAALSLYRKLGFVETFSTEYHAQPIKACVGRTEYQA